MTNQENWEFPDNIKENLENIDEEDDRYPVVEALLWLETQLGEEHSGRRPQYVTVQTFNALKKKLPQQYAAKGDFVELRDTVLPTTYTARADFEDLKNNLPTTYAARTEFEDLKNNLPTTYAAKDAFEDLKNNLPTTYATKIDFDKFGKDFDKLQKDVESIQETIPDPNQNVKDWMKKAEEMRKKLDKEISKDKKLDQDKSFQQRLQKLKTAFDELVEYLSAQKKEIEQLGPGEEKKGQEKLAEVCKQVLATLDGKIILQTLSLANKAKVRSGTSKVPYAKWYKFLDGKLLKDERALRKQVADVESILKQARSQQ